MTDNVVAVEITANAAGAVAGSKEAGAAVRTITPAVEGVSLSLKEMGETALAAFERAVLGANSARIAVVELGESVAAAKAMVNEIGEVMLAAFAVEAIAKFAENMGETAEKTVHMAQTFGLTVAQIQQLKAEAALTGVPVEALGKAMTRLDASFAAAKAGGDKQAQAFKAMGVDVKGSYTQLELLRKAEEGIAAMPDGIGKFTAAYAVFGRNVQALAPLLNMTKEQVEENAKITEDYGAVNEVAAAKGLALAESQNQGKVAMMGLNNVLTDALAPVLKTVVDGMNHMIGAFTASYTSGGLAKTMLEGVVGIIKILQTAVIWLGELFTISGIAIKGWATLATDAGQAVWQIIGPYLTSAVGDLVGSFTFLKDQATNALQTVLGWVKALAEAVGKFLTSLPGVGGAFAKLGADAKKTLGDMKTSADAAAASMAKVWGPDAKVNMPKAGTSTTGDLPGGKPKKDKGGDGGESDMTALQAAFDQRQAANNTMLTNMKADELAYWETVKTNVQGGALTQQDADRVSMKVFTLKHELAMQAIGEQLTSFKAAEAEKVSEITKTLAEAKAAITQQIHLTEDQEAKGEISHTAAHGKIMALIADEVAAEKAAAVAIEQARITADNAILAKTATNTKEHIAALNDLWKAYAQVQGAMTKADADGNAQRAAQDQRVIDQTVKSWTSASKGIVDTWVQGTREMLQGTMTWQQFELKIWNQLLDGVVAMVEKMVMGWVAGEAKKFAATELGNALRTADNAKAAVDGGAIDFLATMKATTNAAVKAASGAYAAMAGIPIIGPELGAAAAGATFIAVEAMGAMASASGGYDIPSGVNPVTQLHAQEMVLPATLANPLRSMLAANGNSHGGSTSTGDGASGGGDNYHITVHAFDAPGVERMMRGPAGDSIVKGLVAKRRNLQGAGVS